MPQKIIPDSLRVEAERLGCNCINFITTAKEGDIFSLSRCDENGAPEDIGLPMFYAVKNGNIHELSIDRIAELSANIKE